MFFFCFTTYVFDTRRVLGLFCLLLFSFLAVLSFISYSCSCFFFFFHVLVSYIFFKFFAFVRFLALVLILGDVFVHVLRSLPCFFFLRACSCSRSRSCYCSVLTHVFILILLGGQTPPLFSFRAHHWSARKHPEADGARDGLQNRHPGQGFREGGSQARPHRHRRGRRAARVHLWGVGGSRREGVSMTCVYVVSGIHLFICLCRFFCCLLIS